LEPAVRLGALIALEKLDKLIEFEAVPKHHAAQALRLGQPTVVHQFEERRLAHRQIGSRALGPKPARRVGQMVGEFFSHAVSAVGFSRILRIISRLTTASSCLAFSSAAYSARSSVARVRS